MSIGKRETILRMADRLTLRMATRAFGLFGPPVTYQPLPWVGLEGGRRAVGSKNRLQAMLAYLERRALSPSVTLDVGANLGFFSLTFAERGAIAYAVEAEPLNVRIAQIASTRIESSSGAFVPIRLWCRPDTISRLPPSNVTLCLSIWHHWVRGFGLEGATSMLRELLGKTSDVLFFDTGENEMPDHYNLPFRDADARSWLQNYLRGFDEAVNVLSLGDFDAFMPDSDERSGNARRQLFAVEVQ